MILSYPPPCPTEVCFPSSPVSSSLGPRPSRDSRTKEGLSNSSSIWDGPIRLQDFACHAIVTFKLTCDGYPNPAPWARHNAQLSDHALVAEMRMRISMCHMAQNANKVPRPSFLVEGRGLGTRLRCEAVKFVVPPGGTAFYHASPRF